jgi:sensor histidine kinase YesM
MYISAVPPSKSLRFFLLLIFLLCTFSSFSQSQPQLDSLKTLFRQTTNDSLKVIRGVKIAREIHRNQHDEKEEFAYAKEAIESALRLNDTVLYARALDNLGLLNRYHQDYDEALVLHRKAFQLVENKNVAAHYKMRFANNAGVASRYHQKYDVAVDFYMKALKIAEKENNLRNIAIANNGIGNALSSISGREDEALQYFLRALEVSKKMENSLGMSMNYLSISGYYIDKKAYKTAREYLETLLQLNKKNQDEFGLAITYEFFGKCFLEEGENLEKAVFYFENALGRFKSLGNKHRQAGILTKLGSLQQKRGNLVQAEDYFMKSLTLSEELEQHGLVRANSLKLSQLLEKRNNHKAALYYYKQAKTYEDSIKLVDQNVKIEMLTNKYNLEKKESQIKLLEKDQALQQNLVKSQKQQLERRRLITILMAVGFILLLVIFFMQYRNYRIKKKTTARIQQEEKEKMNAIYERNLAQSEILVTRLRVNPHFLFNSLNAITYLIQSEQNLKAIKYLKIFSRYTRMVLETSKEHVVPISEELKLAKYYLALEENRFEDGFTYKITDEEMLTIEETMLPPLLLQPFLENAIWHGLLPSKKEKKILHVIISRKLKSIEIIIDDNGVGRDTQKRSTTKKHHKSMGMQIIKERIDLYNKSYSEEISCQIIDKKDEQDQAMGTQVVLTLSKKNSFNY